MLIGLQIVADIVSWLAYLDPVALYAHPMTPSEYVEPLRAYISSCKGAYSIYGNHSMLVVRIRDNVSTFFKNEMVQVGHSLGGTLAQIVGSLAAAPVLSVSGPGIFYNRVT
jgi:hypothetical protein